MMLTHEYVVEGHMWSLLMRISAISLRCEAKRVHVSSVMNMYTFVNEATAAYMTFCVHVEQCPQGSLSPSSSAKLVDCILALKSYHEWKQGGALGFWRLKSPSHPMGYITNSGKYITRSKSMNTSSSQGRRKWAIPDLEGLDDRDLLSSPELSVNSLNFDKDSRASFEEMLHNAHAGQNGVGDGDADEVLSNMHMSGSVFIVPSYHQHFYTAKSWNHCCAASSTLVFDEAQFFLHWSHTGFHAL
jgi:hypothetical protein